MPRIDGFVDEKDKQAMARGNEPLRIEGLDPKMHGRWVRTKGYDAEGHMERMKRLGYVAVERSTKTEKSGNDDRATFAKGAQIDGTVKRGDLMLMQIPKERHEQFRRQQQDDTQRRSRSANARLKQAGGYDETE